ncbi:MULTISPECIES: YjdF family protein [Paenibacillus]|uniref:Ribosomal protein L29 n=1 Tax=Paenibacillus brasilensis TaxID=128574 RepID=A0ABU0KXQ7_9BACL|nr:MULTISPECIES: YjdF family protein [Paenibacillus]MDQ0493028.1 ribosomal protein L29 [Paenibacillus brasilensis]
MKLTVYFEKPYWVGVIETQEKGKIRAARYVFGSEPSDAEVLTFVQSDEMSNLTERMTVVIEGKTPLNHRVNPKRLQRLAAKEIRSRGTNTYAEQAIKLQLEQHKAEKRTMNRERREEIKEYKRDIARLKAKAKHRGR